ncbi:hypothetical protein [Thiohalorhabdus denitrificans]|uniref:hypothetical protein n=1 Tax=Thiohalorhabdus denitrificans TaxID=381306 RepID=UPI00115FF773|nr:hypothetical protein [Thiohalorhabdus denitrificans]
MNNKDLGLAALFISLIGGMFWINSEENVPLKNLYMGLKMGAFSLLLPSLVAFFLSIGNPEQLEDDIADTSRVKIFIVFLILMSLPLFLK